MMRAAVILVGVGSLFAMERGTPPRVAKAVESAAHPINRQRRRFTDTLKVDRLEIAYFQNELPTQPISFELTPPADSHLSFQKGWQDCQWQSARTPRPRRSPSCVPSQDPRSQILNQGPTPDPRPQIPTQSRLHIARRRPWMPRHVGQTRSIAFLNALNLRSGCEA